MSGVRTVTEIIFSSKEMASALTQAALWVQRHDDEIYVETIVGDSDYVAVYYTEDKDRAEPEVQGPGSSDPFRGLFDVTDYPRRVTLHTADPIDYRGRAG